MGFYNSGLRRLTGTAAAARAKIKGDEKIKDDAQAAAIALNTAKNGVTTVQANAITANTGVRTKVYEYVASNAEWNGLDGITSSTGHAFTGEGSPDLRTDTILSIRLETYNPDETAHTPTNITNVAWRFNPYDSFGTAATDNHMFDISFYGGEMDNTAGVHICQGTTSKSFAKTSSTECNMLMADSNSSSLAVCLSGTLDTEGIPNKIRLIVVYVTSGQGGAHFDYSE